jgi:prepilin-type N-terminal cleavage/methylation domain-containing protein
VKDKRSAFTLVELLAVLGIIAIVVALLIPALTAVRKMAKETQQKAQITTIEMGLMAFRNDYGDYPPSIFNFGNPDYYFGAQKLTEALVGWDLLGFHPKSAWRADGKDKDDGDTSYTGATTGSQQERERNLKERKGPYLEVATSNVFRLGNSSSSAEDGLFDNTSVLDKDRYVICDVFGVRKINTSSGSAVKAGTPILYYKANTSSKIFDPNASALPQDNEKNIYNAYDNFSLIILGSVTVDGSQGKDHPLGGATKNLYKLDYEGGIRDSKIAARPWPHRPDSYILISAGADGLYGTSDDIHNF